MQTEKNSLVKLTEAEIKRLEAIRTLAELVRKYAQQIVTEK
ncbi:hypothetical protein [Effusibacillus dendaii]|uniref:Uncharacterized protein n=1 Tax=Effusibacillus dendaii TaxID=2743772 RepID=A0A7I8DBY1_9BACL|nr:hypothetical protein [Effusibacillus dendaii]BCJ87683.1 hypothetical protein skT53_26680 [Effusibacillus dendaii]